MFNNWLNDRATGRLIIGSMIGRQGDTDDPIGKPTPMPLFSHHSTIHEPACDQTRIPGLTGLNLKNTALLA